MALESNINVAATPSDSIEKAALQGQFLFSLPSQGGGGYLRIVNFRLLGEVDRLIAPAADRVSEPSSFRLPKRLRHAFRRESPALSNLVNEMREVLSTTRMVQAEEHDQLCNSDGYTICDFDAITLKRPGNLIQFAS